MPDILAKLCGHFNFVFQVILKPTFAEVINFLNAVLLSGSIYSSD